MMTSSSQVFRRITWLRRVGQALSRAARHRACLATVLTVAFVGTAQAQTNERIFEGLDFRFVTPGARAVGMGVTFVGLADDATAAASNPAGLSNLRHVELSVEFLGTHASQRYLVSNQVNGVPCSPGCDVFTTFGRTKWVLPSFASLAVPIGDFTVAAFMNSQQRVHREFQLEPRFVPAVETPLGTLGPSVQTGEAGRLDVSVRNYGAGGAWAPQPWLSVGGSLVVSHLRLESEGRNLENGELRSLTRTSASVTRPSVFAGILARPAQRMAVGLGYYRGTTFPMRTEVAGTFGNPAGSMPADRCLNESFSRPGRVCQEQAPLRTDYVVPSRIAAGASYRLSTGLTVLGEIAHVRYSALVSPNFQVIDFRFTENVAPADYYYDDVNEYHGGAEYKWIVRGRVMAVRGGLFTDPGHSMRFRVNGLSSADAVQNFVFNANASTGTRVGKTFGLGMTFGNRLQADAAVSLVPGANRFVLSVVRRVL